MSTTESTGFCFLCNEETTVDVDQHFAERHPAITEKPRVSKISWQHRIDSVVKKLSEIKDDQNVEKLDDVIQDLYLVRAKLMELRKRKGSSNGRS